MTISRTLGARGAALMVWLACAGLGASACAGMDGGRDFGDTGSGAGSTTTTGFAPGMTTGLGGSTTGDAGPATGISGSPSSTGSGTGLDGSSNTGAPGSTSTSTTGSPGGMGSGVTGGSTTPTTGASSGDSGGSASGSTSGSTGAMGTTTGDGGQATGSTTGATAGSTTGTVVGGECCSDGDCLCHGPAPTRLTSDEGPFGTDRYELNGLGTAYFPTDAEPPFAAIALTGGFTNSGPEMADWGPFYASHGIVCVITGTVATDTPGIRAVKMLAVIEELQLENENSDSPLYQKLAGRYGVSGYSMGGGGTLQALSENKSLRTGVGLAAWTVGTSSGDVQSPTLLLCGTSDGTAPCSQSESNYGQIPESTPKMLVRIPGTTHFNWFGPKDAGRGVSGDYALAFQKFFLEGDERWKSVLLGGDSDVETNIQ